MIPTEPIEQRLYKPDEWLSLPLPEHNTFYVGRAEQFSYLIRICFQIENKLKLSTKQLAKEFLLKSRHVKFLGENRSFPEKP